MKRLLVTVFFFALCGLPVSAQPTPSFDSEANISSQAVTGPVDSVDQNDDRPRPETETQEDGSEEEKNEQGQRRRRVDGVQLSGQIFTRYGWNVTGTGADRNFNSFALDRWYFTARTALSDDLSFRGTTDILSPDPEGGVNGYTIIVKYAYFDWQIRPDLSLRAGVHQTGWENYMNGVWGYRGVTKTMAHYQGHLSTSDLGMTLSYSLPNQFGNASVGIHNGGGYRSLEADQFKDVSGQVRLTPFAQSEGPLAPLTLSAHAYRGTHTDGLSRTRWGGLAAYNGDRYTLGVNYEARTDGNVEGSGVSTFGTIQLGSLRGVGDVSLLGMLNFYDPNDAETDDRMLRGVAGIAVEPASGLTVTLDYQQRRMQTPVFTQYDGTATDTDAGVFLHIILNY